MWRVKSLEATLRGAERKSLQRSLGPIQLTLLGIGSTIGTGIFVLTAEAAQLAGPGMTISFILAALVCGVATLCYAEMAAMAPVSGAAYAYAYASFGEFWAWAVGWALVLEYAITGSAVAVGWSGYLAGLLRNSPLHFAFPASLSNGPYAGGVVNLPAVLISVLVTALLVRGTQESARVNAVGPSGKLPVNSLFNTGDFFIACKSNSQRICLRRLHGNHRQKERRRSALLYSWLTNRHSLSCPSSSPP